jgi:protein-S-isoprenylcysteine O-methyltransferase Ste14
MTDTEIEFTPPRVLPPHYFVLSILLILASLFTRQRLFDGVWIYLGLVPMLVGVAMAARGSVQFKQADTNIIPLTKSDALVTEGVFRYSRNPMYLGMVGFTAGLALVVNTPWAWLVVAVFFLIIRILFIRREERLMAATFGEPYAAYKRQVRRWL